MRALVTAFEPFGGDHVNTSYEAVRRLPARNGGLDITTALLPTSYARASAVLEQEIARLTPHIVLCTGEASGRHALNIERIAINVQDARIPDNDGAQPHDTPVVPGGPTAYLATLPIKSIAAALCADGLATEISNSAGTFVCNHVFYGLMHCATRNQEKFCGGFLHVPCLGRQAAGNVIASTLSLDDIVRGILIALEATRMHVSQSASRCQG